jgi:hypothetical protein
MEEKMEYLQIGSLTLPVKFLFLGLSLVHSLLFLTFRVKKTIPEQKKEILDTWINTIILWFIIWKFSFIVVEPSLAMKSPLSILYFTGGKIGLVISIFASAVYFLLKMKKLKISISGIIDLKVFYWLTVVGIYHLLYVILQEEMIMHAAQGAVSITLVLWIYSRSPYEIVKKYPIIVFIFSVFSLFLSYIFPQNTKELFFFSFDQWLYILLAFISLLFQELISKRDVLS